MTSPLIPPLSSLLVWPDGQAPWAKQEEVHQRSSGARLYALLMEQRTGKTVVALGTASYQYQRFLEAGGFGGAPSGRSGVQAVQPPASVNLGGALPKLPKFERLSDIPKKPSKPGMIYRPEAWANKGLDAMLVVALPSGVPRNWRDEIERRLPASMRAKTFLWSSDRAANVGYAEEFRRFVSHEGFIALLINGEAIPTALAKKAIGTFLRARRALVVGDETSLICSQPGNVRAHVMEAIKKLPGAICRRILDGTPGDETPLDLFSQFSFLDKKILGFDSWVAFKAYYASWVVDEIYVPGGEKRKIRKQEVDDAGKKVYANLDVMAKSMAPYSFRVKRADCFDVPAKLYQPYRFELSAAQRKVYDPLREEFEAELRDGTIVSAAHALARMTRLDQVASNYWPSIKLPTICSNCAGDGCEACGDVGALIVATEKKIIDPERNPRIDALAEVISANREPGIVWAVFDETIDAVMALGEKLGLNPARYDGKVPEDEKAANKAAFQGGRSGLFVSKEASGGRGLDLSAAGWMAYAENSYSKRKRSQSEDRAEVAGRTRGTGIVDLIALDTYDEAKLAAHAAKGAASEFLWNLLRREHA